MILNDSTIRRLGPSLIDPYKPERVQPASYDLALGNEFITFPESPLMLGILGPIDLAGIDDDGVNVILGPNNNGLAIRPGEFVLGVTEERVSIPDNLVARLEGKSSIGRIGLLIHVTAGFVDPGWDGRLTLEIYNVRRRSIILRPGLPFCQLSFTQMVEAAEKPYEGRYQHDSTVATSRYGEKVS